MTEQLPRSEEYVAGGGMTVMSAYLCSKYGEDELARVEGVENISDNVEVGGGWNV